MKPYYDHGGVTIYHGDALEVLPTLEGVGAVVTDPPYSSGGAFRGDRARGTVEKYVSTDYLPEFAGDTRDQRGFLAWSGLWLNGARHACDAGALLATFIDWRQLPTMTDAAQVGGWVWRGVATWWKRPARPRLGGFAASSEFVVWGTNGPLVEHDRSTEAVFECPPVASADREHVAEKPEKVARWLLGAARPGALVLDPFMGSGTTLRAAKDRGCPAVGIDVDERYCEAAAARLGQEVLAV